MCLYAVHWECQTAVCAAHLAACHCCFPVTISDGSLAVFWLKGGSRCCEHPGILLKHRGLQGHAPPRGHFAPI